MILSNIIYVIGASCFLMNGIETFNRGSDSDYFYMIGTSLLFVYSVECLVSEIIEVRVKELKKIDATYQKIQKNDRL